MEFLQALMDADAVAASRSTHSLLVRISRIGIFQVVVVHLSIVWSRVTCREMGRREVRFEGQLLMPEIGILTCLLPDCHQLPCTYHLEAHANPSVAKQKLQGINETKQPKGDRVIGGPAQESRLDSRSIRYNLHTTHTNKHPYQTSPATTAPSQITANCASSLILLTNSSGRFKLCATIGTGVSAIHCARLTLTARSEL